MVRVAGTTLQLALSLPATASADGYLMPARKDQLPPDLRYFKQTGK